MKGINNILLVEDNEVFNFLAVEAIKEIGATGKLRIATDGEKACEIIEKFGNPDIIFLDINMPRMDGFEFLNFFEDRNKSQFTKVVMLTSSIRPEDKQTAFSYPSVVDYYEKPLTSEILVKILSDHFESITSG